MEAFFGQVAIPTKLKKIPNYIINNLGPDFILVAAREDSGTDNFSVPTLAPPPYPEGSETKPLDHYVVGHRFANLDAKVEVVFQRERPDV